MTSSAQNVEPSSKTTLNRRGPRPSSTTTGVSLIYYGVPPPSGTPQPTPLTAPSCGATQPPVKSPTQVATTRQCQTVTQNLALNVSNLSMPATWRNLKSPRVSSMKNSGTTLVTKHLLNMRKQHGQKCIGIYTSTTS